MRWIAHPIMCTLDGIMPGMQVERRCSTSAGAAAKERVTLPKTYACPFKTGAAMEVRGKKVRLYKVHNSGATFLPASMVGKVIKYLLPKVLDEEERGRVPADLVEGAPLGWITRPFQEVGVEPADWVLPARAWRKLGVEPPSPGATACETEPASSHLRGGE